MPTFLSPPEAIGNADPSVMRTDYLALPLIGYSSHESGPCILHRQYNRAVSSNEVGDTVEGEPSRACGRAETISNRLQHFGELVPHFDWARVGYERSVYK